MSLPLVISRMANMRLLKQLNNHTLSVLFYILGIDLLVLIILINDTTGCV